MNLPRTGLTVIPARDSTTALDLESNETPAALLEDLLLGNSTVSDGIGQEIHGRESLALNPIEASITSMPSGPLKLMPSETARDVDGLSSLSENRAVQHDTTINSAPPLSHFHQIFIDKFPDLKCTTVCLKVLTQTEVTHRTVHYHPPAGYVYRVRTVVLMNSKRYHYDVQVLFVSVKEEVVSTD